MELKKSFDPVDGDILSKSSLVSFVRRAVKLHSMNGSMQGVLHLHIAGPSGRGKTFLAFQLSKMLAAVIESEDLDCCVLLAPLDSFGSLKGDKWIYDVDSIIRSINAGLMSRSAAFTVLITEGRADNDEEVFSSILALSDVGHSVCCVVEPDVYTWIAINIAKSKNPASDFNFPSKWNSYWKSAGSLTVSKAIEAIQSETRQSVSRWNDYPCSVVVVTNHTYAAIKEGWFDVSISKDDSIINVITNSKING